MRGAAAAPAQRQPNLFNMGFQRAVNPAPVAPPAIPPAPQAPAVPPGHFALTGGTGPPIPPAPPLGNGGSATAVAYLRQRLLAIHIHHPNHEMFGAIGAIAVGRVCMPYNLPAGRANAVCWYNAIDSLCSRRMAPPLVWGQSHCWMSTATQYKITQQIGRATQLCKSFRAVRFFAFLMQPTDQHWISLRDGQANAPFDHYCGRGEATDPAQNNRVCINGVEHGEFSNRNWNEERKQCKNGALCLCPGHGPQATKCIFTHPDGTPRVCRNIATHVPQCACQPPCF